MIRAIALGVVQGLTEFLPVSSSGHLVLAQQLFPSGIEDSLAFDVCLHFGTLLAVVVYFRRDLIAMAAAVLGSTPEGEEYLHRWVGLLALASVPIAIVGASLRHQLAHAFESVAAVGLALLFTAALLMYASRCMAGERGPGALNARDALWIGLFQAIAVIPGISRSGSTIAGALSCGIDRATSARFAFLLSLPAIVGAMLGNLGEVGGLLRDEPAAVLAGVAAAALTGWFAIDIMMRAVRVGRLVPFAVYCSVLGLGALLVSVL